MLNIDGCQKVLDCFCMPVGSNPIPLDVGLSSADFLIDALVFHPRRAAPASFQAILLADAERF